MPSDTSCGVWSSYLSPNGSKSVRLLVATMFVTILFTSGLWVATARAAQLAETTGSEVRTASSVLFEGRIDPGGEATSYYFEFGSSGPCSEAACVSTAVTEAGAPEELLLVAQRVSGLAPSTIYHYRVVAKADGTSVLTYGNDMSVTTRSTDAPLTHGASAGPPGSDRVWEQASASDTGGHSVVNVEGLSSDATKLIYSVRGGTPLSSVGGIATPVFAERRAAGWLSSNMTPPQSEPGSGKSWEYMLGSSDLSTIIGSTARDGRTFPWSLAPNGPYHQLSSVKGIQSFFTISEDGSRVVDAATESLDPTIPSSPGTYNLYDISDATAHLADILPTGSPPTCGVVQPDFSPFGLPGLPQPSDHWLSGNGDLLVFPTAGSPISGECNPGRAQLYARNFATSKTVRISGPSLEGPECPAAFIRATSDTAYFWTKGDLSPSDTVPQGECFGQTEGTDGDVYAFDLETNSLSCMTCMPGRADVEIASTAIGARESLVVAADGSRIYFASARPLVPGAPERAYYRLDTTTGNIRLIIPSGTSSFNIGTYNAAFQAATEDGNVIVFPSANPHLNALGGLTNGGERQYYIYNDVKESLTCVSCPQSGAVPRSSSEVSRGKGGLVAANNLIGPNVTPLSADGSIFAFSTPTPLVGDDQNTAGPSQEPSIGTDAYEWRNGGVHLLSDGRASWPPATSGTPSVAPTIAAVSPSGGDIFFVEAKNLVEPQLDEFSHLFDASFRRPQASSISEPSGCVGLSCGAPGSSPSITVEPGTGVVDGGGNQRPPHHRKQKKAKHKHKRHQKHKQHTRRKSVNSERAARG